MKGNNSHIQLPHGVLKYFRDEFDPEKRVWYLDISTGNIMRKSATKLGASKGYYSEACESFWNKEIESPLAQLNNKIRLFGDLKIETVRFPAEDIAIFKRYIKAAAVRSEPAYILIWSMMQVVRKPTNYLPLPMYQFRMSNTF